MLQRMIRGLFPLDRQMAWPGMLLFAYLLVIIAAYVILKAVRDSLYLDAFGAVKLPYVIIGIAAIVGLFVDGYIRLSRHVAVTVLSAATLLFLITNLVVFWSIGRTGQPWLYPILYIWVGCFGVIAPVQVWTLANEVLATRQAKRLVGLIGAGGIVGAVSGGALAGVLADTIGTNQLLLVVTGMLIVCIGLIVILSRWVQETHSAPTQRTPQNLRQAVRTILDSPHLKVVGALVWLTAVCTTIVDYQFKATASAAGFSRDELTSFFGTVYSGMALVCLGVQLLAVRGTLRRFGLGKAVLVLPILLLLGTAGLVVFGTLLAATLLKSSDGAFKHSMDRSSKELAYLPVSAEIKVSVKSAIDMVLDRLGDGSAGVLLMILATWLGLGTRPIGVVNLLLLCGWLAVALALRRSYLNELESSLGQRQPSLEVGHESVLDADTQEAMVAALGSANESEVLAALEIITQQPQLGFEDQILSLAKNGSPRIRARVFEMMLEAGDDDLPSELTQHLELEDQQLLAQALDLVLAKEPDEILRQADELIGDSPPETKGAMLALLVRRLGPDFEPLAQRIMHGLTARESPASVRCAAATALGLLPRDSSLGNHLPLLLNDDDVEVRRRAAEAAGRLRRLDTATQLVPLLGSPRTRRAARHALSKLDQHAVRPLLSALLHEGTAPQIRKRIPSLLATLPAGDVMPELAQSLTSPKFEIRKGALETLHRRKRVAPDEPVAEELSTSWTLALAREIATGHRLLENWCTLTLSNGHDGDRSFLASLVHGATRESLRRIFRWLEWHGSSRSSLRAVWDALHGTDVVRRENAIELLDGMLDRDLKPSVLALVERMPWRAGADASERLEAGATAVKPADAEAGIRPALYNLVEGSDPWLAAWAVNVARRQGIAEVIQLAVTEAPRHNNQLGLFDEELARAASHEEQQMARATVLDKVMALKSVELFRIVPTEDLVPMARVARESRFEASESLFEEGDPAGPLFIVLSGRVALRRGEAPAGEVPAGTALGAWALFDDHPRNMTAQAVEPTHALVVERDDFYDVLAEHVTITRSLIGNLLQRVQGLTI